MFSELKPLPTDPILGLMAAFKQDTNPKKIDLGVGVYKDEQGNTPVLKAVKKAEAFRLENETSKSYIGLAGNLDYCQNPHEQEELFYLCTLYVKVVKR